MNGPQYNQVWITNAGRYCLIVWHYEGPWMLWWDGIDGIWNVTRIEDRLKSLTKLTPAKFFAKMEGETK